MSDAQLFAFEQDFVDSLRCIPMAVRIKLDLCGIKLTLRQWSRFTRDDRQGLLERSCIGAAEAASYAQALAALVAARTHEVVRPLAEPPCRTWEHADEVPAAVANHARAAGLAAPSTRQWRGLTPLQRFALVKLTRDNHDNVNFEPALREFGLVAPSDLGFCARGAQAQAFNGPPRPTARPRV